MRTPRLATRSLGWSSLALLVLLTLVACGATAQEPPPNMPTTQDLPAHTPDATISRDHVPDAYKWDLSPLFDSVEAWEAKRTAVTADIMLLALHKGRLADPNALLECLTLYFRVHTEGNFVSTYGALLKDAEQTNEQYDTMAKQGVALMDLIMKEAGFIRAEVLAISDEDMAAAYIAQPGLTEHKNYLEGLRRRRARLLNEEGERILSLVGDNLWAEIDLNEIPSPAEETFFSLLSDIPWPIIKDAEGKDYQLTLSNYGPIRHDPNREVRRAAVQAMFGTLRQYQHAFTGTLSAQFKFDVTLARARNYDTALEAYLDRDNLDPAVYHNLIATVNANLTPLHRYITLRKKILGLDKVHLYDLYIPLVEDVKTTVTFAEASETILAALEPMGEDYLTVLREGLDLRNGWIDLYPSKDKGSGAFSVALYGPHPWVKMNYQDNANDMSTLAHEFGHALHSYLAMKHQNAADWRYVAFLAEIASTANEALLNDYQLSQATDDKTRAALLNERLERIRGTIYRQTLFAEFELRVHEMVEQGVPLTAELLDKTYSELVQRYYGPDYVLDVDDGMEWAYVPHFYWKYYLFTYATGLSSGLAIAQLVKQGPEQREAYLGMLKAGSSDTPLNILKGAGVDLTRPDAIEAALADFDRTLTELEGLLAMQAATPTP